MVQISGRESYKQGCISEVNMFQETISDEYIVIQSGTSEGSQIKYRKDNYWYKKDNRGHEGRTEY